MRPVTYLLATVCGLGLASAVAADEAIQWQSSLETAQRMAAQSNRLVLIHFWAPWCKPCLNMEKNVFSLADTGHALEANFVLVKLNADDSPSTAKMYQVSSLPTDVIITPNGRLVAAIQSPPTAAVYVAQMNRAADGFRQLNQSAQAGGSRSSSAQNPYGAVPADASAHAANAAGAATPEQQYAAYAQSQGGPTQGGAAQGNPAQSGQSAPGESGGYGAPAAAGGQYAPPSYGSAAHDAHAAADSYGAPAAAQQPVAAGPNPVGLDGYCPVTLLEQKRWAQGDKRFGAIHRGRTYLFGNQEAQQRFLANPDAFSPVIQGNDPVLALDSRQSVAGRRDHGLVYENRVYLFANEESLKQFQQNPKRYAAEIVQAMR